MEQYCFVFSVLYNSPRSLNNNQHCVKKCAYSEFFWSVFLLCISPYSVQMWEYKDQKNSEYGHFLSSANLKKIHRSTVKPHWSTHIFKTGQYRLFISLWKSDFFWGNKNNADVKIIFPQTRRQNYYLLQQKCFSLCLPNKHDSW